MFVNLPIWSTLIAETSIHSQSVNNLNNPSFFYFVNKIWEIYKRQNFKSFEERNLLNLILVGISISILRRIWYLRHLFIRTGHIILFGWKFGKDKQNFWDYQNDDTLNVTFDSQSMYIRKHA